MSPNPNIGALLNAWLAMEALQPQTFPKQEKVISEENPRRGRGERKAAAPATLLVSFDIEAGDIPWETQAGKWDFLDLKEDQILDCICVKGALNDFRGAIKSGDRNFSTKEAVEAYTKSRVWLEKELSKLFCRENGCGYSSLSHPLLGASNLSWWSNSLVEGQSCS